MKYFSEKVWFSCCLFCPLVHGAAVHAVAHRVPVCQLGVQLARPVRQLQQRHLLPEPLQRVGGFRHRAAVGRPPSVPPPPADSLAELHLQRFGRADPPGEQDPSPLQRVWEEQPPQARAAAPQPLHTAADRPPGSAAQTPPAPHGQHETGRNRWPASPQSQASAPEGVPAIGASSGALGWKHKHTLAYFALFYSALILFCDLHSQFTEKPASQSETDQTSRSGEIPLCLFSRGNPSLIPVVLHFPALDDAIGEQGQSLGLFTEHSAQKKLKHGFDTSTNLYIGINENCFCLKYWKQSLLSVSLARFFSFF